MSMGLPVTSPAWFCGKHVEQNNQHDNAERYEKQVGDDLHEHVGYANGNYNQRYGAQSQDRKIQNDPQECPQTATGREDVFQG